MQFFHKQKLFLIFFGFYLILQDYIITCSFRYKNKKNKICIKIHLENMFKKSTNYYDYLIHK